MNTSPESQRLCEGTVIAKVSPVDDIPSAESTLIEITKMKCMQCSAVFKKRAYLNRHLKRIHGQGTSGQYTGGKLVELVPPTVETERSESDHDLSSGQ